MSIQKSIHDKLKPIELKYLKIVEYDCKIYIIKKRFIYHKCNKRFTENLDLTQKVKTVSNKLEQKILNSIKSMLKFFRNVLFWLLSR